MLTGIRFKSFDTLARQGPARGPPGVRFAGEKFIDTPAEVAHFYGVNVRTVLNWVAEEKLLAIRTAGGLYPNPTEGVFRE